MFFKVERVLFNICFGILRIVKVFYYTMSFVYFVVKFLCSIVSFLYFFVNFFYFAMSFVHLAVIFFLFCRDFSFFAISFFVCHDFVYKAVILITLKLRFCFPLWRCLFLCHCFAFVAWQLWITLSNLLKRKGILNPPIKVQQLLKKTDAEGSGIYIYIYIYMYIYI